MAIDLLELVNEIKQRPLFLEMRGNFLHLDYLPSYIPEDADVLHRALLDEAGPLVQAFKEYAGCLLTMFKMRHSWLCPTPNEHRAHWRCDAGTRLIVCDRCAEHETLQYN